MRRNWDFQSLKNPKWKLVLKNKCVLFFSILEALLSFHGQCQVCSANNFYANYHPETYLVYYSLSKIKMSFTGLCQIWSQGRK